jgi:hypothetical protein
MRGLSRSKSGSVCAHEGACAVDNAADGERSSGGGNRSNCLFALAQVFPAACSGDTVSATHRYAESTHDLLRGKLLGVVPGKIILAQPAARADNGDTQHFSVTRRARARSSSRVLNTYLGHRLAQDGLVNDDLGKQNLYFSVRCFGTGGPAEFDVSGRSRGRFGSLQNGYGRGCGSSHWSGSCCGNVLLALSTLSGARLRHALSFPRRIGENGYARRRMRLANRR